MENSDDYKKALIQVDFAENYACKHPGEIQNAHWKQMQISLFTVAIRHSDVFKPHVLASDDSTHAKETVITYIDHVSESLLKGLEVCIWSDGPSSQFKNRYVTAAVCELQKKYGFII